MAGERRLRKHVPLWAVLPALKAGEAAMRELREGAPPGRAEQLWRRIEAGLRVEKDLRDAGYWDEGPRGDLFRRTGDIAESEEEAAQALKKLGPRRGLVPSPRELERRIAGLEKDLKALRSKRRRE